MFVKSANGLSVRDPDRNDRLPEGKYREVPNSDYWHRRRRDGDVLARDDAPKPDEIEGYEPSPEPVEAAPAKRGKLDA